MLPGGQQNRPSDGPPPSQNIQTLKPAVSFLTNNVPPSQYLYLQENDYLQIVIITNVGAQGLIGRYRFLTPQGEIKEGTFNQPTLTAGGFTVLVVPLSEGWLLSVNLNTTNIVAAGQWTFAQMQITRSPTFTGNVFGTFWSGYVYFSASTGWPGIPSKEVYDGTGVLRSVTGTTPGVGAEISETVPNGRRWNLISLSASLTTSAVVANRTPMLILDDGANTFFECPSFNNQAASLSLRYSISQNQPTAAPVTGVVMLGLPGPVSLKSGFRIRTSTPGLQAGDQWTAPQYLVQEWGAWLFPSGE